jgi:biopolymer transport protein TolR
MADKLLMDLGGSAESSMARVSPKKRRWLRSNYLICRIDVSALLAVILVLLVIFMSTPVNHHPRGAVDLAKVSHPRLMRDAVREDALIVAVLRDGRVFFRTGSVQTGDLPAQLREALAHGAEKKVYIKADARARFASVKDVLHAVQESGVENVAFITDQRHPQAQ